MMQRDYYVLRQVELTDSLSRLAEAVTALDQAKNIGDKQKRQQAKETAESQMGKEARNAVAIEPHLAYLWFWAKKEEAEKADNKDGAKGASEAANSIRDAWQKRLVSSTMPDAFRLLPGVSAIAHMPPLSFILHVPFKLQKPYISKDERDFYLLDNPLRKEKIFQSPMVAATSWKGALRAALWQLDYKAENEVTIRLLGNPRGSDEHQAGRLYFYPTFFENIGLEVINPHSRETGVGWRPILIECVPKGTATLLLLYVPFGPIEQSEDDRRATVAEDLEVLAKGVEAMLTTYGFGAKTSSGFGIAQDRLASQGTLALRAELLGVEATSVASAEPPQPAPELPRYLESPTRLHADLRRPDGSLKSEEEYQGLIQSRGQKYAKKEKQIYDKAKAWWEREGRQLAEAATQEPTPESSLAPPQTPPVTELTFTSLSELRELAQRVAAQLRDRGDV